MARPPKALKVCRIPCCQEFHPVSSPQTSVHLVLSVEEYETIRLIDYMGKNQQDAARHMNVARTTVQALYSEARKKLARFLVEGTCLQIQGGNYELCGHPASCKKSQLEKGDLNMKIAVTYENGQVFQHFGHTEEFKIYTVEDGRILSCEVVSTDGQGHGALAGFLADREVSVLICGGIGGGARNALAEAGVELYPGASGNADAQVASFLQGNLSFDPNTSCSHHGHGEEHSCGEHTCH